MSLNLARQATLTAARGTRQMSTQAKVLAERAVSATKHNGATSSHFPRNAHASPLFSSYGVVDSGNGWASRWHQSYVACACGAPNAVKGDVRIRDLSDPAFGVDVPSITGDPPPGACREPN